MTTSKITLLPVVFMVYNTLQWGKNKGKVDPRSVHHVTLYRDIKKGETVGDTIERLKLMYSEYHYDSKNRPIITSKMTQRFKIESAPETDSERTERYKAQGLEIITTENLERDNSKENPTVGTLVSQDANEQKHIAAYDAEVEQLLEEENL